MAAPISKAELLSWMEAVPGPYRLRLLGCAVAIAALGLGAVAIHRPWVERRQELIRKVQEETRSSQLLTTIRSQEKELKDEEQALLLEGGTSALTSALFRLASESGFSMESVIPQPELAFGHYKRVQVQVVAKGGFPALLTFLTHLERHEPLLKVDRLSIETPSETEPPVATLWVSSYSRMEEETPGR